MTSGKAGWCLAPGLMVELDSNLGSPGSKWRVAFGTHTASLLVSGKCPVVLAVGSYLEADGHCMTSYRWIIDSEPWLEKGLVVQLLILAPSRIGGQRHRQLGSESSSHAPESRLSHFKRNPASLSPQWKFLDLVRVRKTTWFCVCFLRGLRWNQSSGYGVQVSLRGSQRFRVKVCRRNCRCPGLTFSNFPTLADPAGLFVVSNHDCPPPAYFLDLLAH